MIAPPLLVSFTELDNYINALSTNNQMLYKDQIESLFERKLPPIVSVVTLSLLFGFSPSFVMALINNSSKQYRSFVIKKGKKKREIQAPKVGLKVIQKWFGYHLAKALTYNEHVFGFIPYRSAIDAASKHCRASWVYSVDIKDFFPSTKIETVLKALIKLGYSQEAAELISKLCCYEHRLPQGAPSSPPLSNLVMMDIDTNLSHLALEHNLCYTRYADDIVFSGNGEFPEVIINKTKKNFDNTDWELNSAKEYFANVKKGQRLKVHGLLVMGDKPILTKGYRNKLRSYKYMISNNKVRAQDIPRLKGHIEYAQLIDNWNYR